MATSENDLSVEQVSIVLEDTHSSEDTSLPQPLPRSSNIVTGSSERKTSRDVEYTYSKLLRLLVESSIKSTSGWPCTYPC